MKDHNGTNNNDYGRGSNTCSRSKNLESLDTGAGSGSGKFLNQAGITGS